MDARLGDLSLRMPDNFEDKTMVVLRASALSESIHATLVINRRAATGDDASPTLHKLKQEILEQGLPDLRFLGEQQVTVGGTNGVCVEISHTAPPGTGHNVELYRATVLLPRSDFVYELVWTDALANREAAHSTLDEVLATTSFSS